MLDFINNISFSPAIQSGGRVAAAAIQTCLVALWGRFGIGWAPLYPGDGSLVHNEALQVALTSVCPVNPKDVPKKTRGRSRQGLCLKLDALFV